MCAGRVSRNPLCLDKCTAVWCVLPSPRPLSICGSPSSLSQCRPFGWPDRWADSFSPCPAWPSWAPAAVGFSLRVLHQTFHVPRSPSWRCTVKGTNESRGSSRSPPGPPGSNRGSHVHLTLVTEHSRSTDQAQEGSLCGRHPFTMAGVGSSRAWEAGCGWLGGSQSLSVASLDTSLAPGGPLSCSLRAEPPAPPPCPRLLAWGRTGWREKRGPWLSLPGKDRLPQVARGPGWRPPPCPHFRSGDGLALQSPSPPQLRWLGLDLRLTGQIRKRGQREGEGHTHTQASGGGWTGRAVSNGLTQAPT